MRKSYSSQAKIVFKTITLFIRFIYVKVRGNIKVNQTQHPYGKAVLHSLAATVIVGKANAHPQGTGESGRLPNQSVLPISVDSSNFQCKRQPRRPQDIATLLRTFFPITHPSFLPQTYPSFLHHHPYLARFLVLAVLSFLFSFFSRYVHLRRSRDILDIFACFRFDRGLNFTRKILLRGPLWQTGTRWRNE